MSGFLDSLLHADPVWLLAVVAALVFAEDALFVGFAIPGESAAVVAGVATSLSGVSLPVAIVVVVVAAIAGDSVGYEVGRHFFGPKLLESRFLDRHRSRVDSAQDLLRRRGGTAVLLGRFTAFFRALMPALAGASRMPYRTFLPWNAFGGIVWGTGFVLLGHVAGSSYQALEATAGRVSGLVFAVVVLALVVVWRVHRHRAGHSPQAGSQPSMSSAERDAGPV